MNFKRIDITGLRDGGGYKLSINGKSIESRWNKSIADSVKAASMTADILLTEKDLDWSKAQINFSDIMLSAKNNIIPNGNITDLLIMSLPMVRLN